MSKQTKGRIKQHLVDDTALIDENGDHVAITFISELDYDQNGIRREADAERLAACWNAMLGIHDPSAFMADAYELLDRLETCFDQRSDIVDGDYGTPEPNVEMQHLVAIRAIMAAMEKGN